MRKSSPRTPKNYDGTRVTTKMVGDLLPDILAQIRTVHCDRPDLVLMAWPEIMGPKLSSMTQAVSLSHGVLTVKVKNSTLHSLLSRQEKFRILSLLKKRFPNADIQNIIFRIA